MDSIIFNVCTKYGQLHSLIHNVFGFNIPGYGYLLRKLSKNRIIQFDKKQFFFDHNIADNYARIIYGKYNEPETHSFIRNIIDSSTSKIRFVDIGANIGEFIFDFADHPNIAETVAFEPQDAQYNVIKENIRLNNFNNTEVVKKAVYDKEGTVKFNIEENNQTSSGIREEQSANFVEIPCTSIDAFFSEKQSIPTIFLIDAEGAELSIIKGGINFIKANQPIIIFEYNYVSKRYFNLSDIEKELGPQYSISRLNNKGELDKDFSKTWNCVAMPQNFQK